MNTAIYTRTSVKEADNGIQLAACRNFCQTNGHNVAVEISDFGSGNDLARPGLSALRFLVGEAMIDTIVVYSTDRLSRDEADLDALRTEFASAGVELITVS